MRHIRRKLRLTGTVRHPKIIRRYTIVCLRVHWRKPTSDSVPRSRYTPVPTLDIIYLMMVVSGLLRVASRTTRSCVATRRCGRSLYSTDGKVRYYTKKHEWVSVDGGVGTVGISSYAQDALGEVVFAQLPDVGKEIEAGAECGALESVKAASEVYSPVSGTVSEKNIAVESTPSLINKSCYGEGWLFRVKMTRPEEVQALMDQNTYDKFLAESH